jgi:hypothetical protein
MNAWKRVRTVAVLQGRELLRRRLALALVVAVPLAWYLTIPPGEEFGVVAADWGLAFAVAAAAFFAVLSWRRVDPRLGLAGFRPLEQVLGRLVLLETVGITVGVIFFPFILWRSAIERPALLALGLVATALIAVPIGFAIAQLLPRELEGTIAILGVIGLEMSLPAGSAVAPFLPLYGPLELLRASIGAGGEVGVLLLHVAGSMTLLLLISLLAWLRRVRVVRWERAVHGVDLR